jgi:hypothetical protein
MTAIPMLVVAATQTALHPARARLAVMGRRVQSSKPVMMERRMLAVLVTRIVQRAARAPCAVTALCARS